jgi:hypothetical protein
MPKPVIAKSPDRLPLIIYVSVIVGLLISSSSWYMLQYDLSENEPLIRELKSSVFVGLMVAVVPSLKHFIISKRRKK